MTRQRTSADEDVKRLEPSCLPGANVKCAGAGENHLGQFLKWLNRDPANTLPGIYPKEMKTFTHTKLIHEGYSSTIHYSPKPKYPSTMNRYKKCGIPIRWNVIQLQEGRKYWFMLRHG